METYAAAVEKAQEWVREVGTTVTQAIESSDSGGSEASGEAVSTVGEGVVGSWYAVAGRGARAIRSCVSSVGDAAASLTQVPTPSPLFLSSSLLVVAGAAAVGWYIKRERERWERGETGGGLRGEALKNHREHLLFQTFPLSAAKEMPGIGLVPVPYHSYDGTILTLHGVCDYGSAEDLVRGDHVVPVPLSSGAAASQAKWPRTEKSSYEGCRAAMVIEIFNVCDSSLGPHTEVQLLLYVCSDRTAVPVSGCSWQSLVALDAMAGSKVRRLCVASWQSTQLAASYSASELGLDVRIASARVHEVGGRTEFAFADRSGGGEMLLSGRISRPALSWSIVGVFKWWKLLQAVLGEKTKVVVSNLWTCKNVMCQQQDQQELEAGEASRDARGAGQAKGGDQALRPNAEGLVFEVQEGTRQHLYSDSDVLIWGSEYQDLGFKCLYVDQASHSRRVKLGLHNAGHRVLSEGDMLRATGWEDVPGRAVR